ncbi:hypothetical protein ACFX13_034906 [Malus domestica]
MNTTTTKFLGLNPLFLCLSPSPRCLASPFSSLSLLFIVFQQASENPRERECEYSSHSEQSATQPALNPRSYPPPPPLLASPPPESPSANPNPPHPTISGP